MPGDKALSTGLWLSTFVAPFNLGVAYILMPTIVRDHGTTIGTGQAAVVLLALVTAFAIPAAENLGRVFGRRLMLYAGLTLFAVGIVVVVAGSTPTSLLLGLSVLTGLGSAVLMTGAYSSTATLEDLKMTPTGLAIAITAGALLGPATGGVIATLFSWQWAFGSQLFLLALIAWLATPLPRVPDLAESRVDWLGSLLILIALGSVLVAVGLAGEFGWWRELQDFEVAGTEISPFGLSIVPVLLVFGVVVATIAVALQRLRRVSKGSSTAWQLGSLRDWGFGLVVILVIVSTMIDGGINFVLYTYLPFATDLDLLDTVLVLLPKAALALIVTIWLAKRQTGWRVPGGPIPAGFLVMTAGVVVLAFTSASATVGLVVTGMVLVGIGSGLAGTGLVDASESSAEAADRGLAGAMHSSSAEFGIALGIAVFGSILAVAASITAIDVQAELAGVTLSDGEVRRLARQLDDELTRMTEIEQLELIEAIDDSALLDEVVETSVGEGMAVVFAAMAVIAFAAFLGSLRLSRQGRSP